MWGPGPEKRTRYARPQQAAPAARPTPSPAPAAPVQAAAAGPAPVEAEPRPDRLAPRAVAPENNANLSAMGELAIISAASAINRHAHTKKVGRVRSKLGVAVVFA